MFKVSCILCILMKSNNMKNTVISSVGLSLACTCTNNEM